MDHRDLPLTINNQYPIPINVQMKEQIKWLIGKDLLRPGDTLPSTNHLAEQLSINRNTIQWVYSQLKEEGLLLMQKGKGTQVADQSSIDTFKQNNPYFTHVEQMIKAAYESGYDAESMLLSGFAYIQLFGQPLKRQLQYLFFECKLTSCYFYLNEIRKMTTAEIETMDISAPEEVRNKAIRNADVIVTTQELSEVIRGFEHTDNKSIITVGNVNDVSLLLNMFTPK